MEAPAATPPKIMVISGTSRGLGRGMAMYFSTKGWRVCGCSRGESDLDVPGYAHSIVDVTDETQVRRWIRGTKQQHGRIDALICNVGLVKSALLLPMIPLELFNQFYELSLKATFLVCREVVKVMALQRAGRIVNIASIMTLIHEPGTAAYSANKAGIIEMTKVLAREVAKQGITCNVVSPSLVTTDASTALGEDWQQRMLAMQTIQRAVEVNELCSVIEFFLIPESACVTGQVINTCMV